MGPKTLDSGRNQGMFSRAENVLITGGTFVANEVSHPSSDPNSKWMNLLQANTSVGAFHNSGERHDAPKCHPETRVAVNREIMDWVRDKGRTHQILWIYGPAGAGKSSIAQTIAELCEEEGSLASDFFFSRTIAGRNTDTRLVSSLACQLTVTIPDIRPYIAAAINEDTLIFSRSLQTQFDALILKPMKQLSSCASDHDDTKERSCPYLFIIDGLDECGTPESQLYILSSLTSALDKDKSSTIPLLFLIASRAEQVIRDTFNGVLNARTRRIVLDDKYEPDEDIRRFLNSKFAEIKKTHATAENLPANWPSSSDLNYLVQKASGQFIYAATVMKFIASPKARPQKALNIVLKLTSPGSYTPFAVLDALYKHILLSIDEEDLKKALIIFAFLFLTSKLRVTDRYGHAIYPSTAAAIENFLGYESGEVSLVMSDLHSIVHVPPWRTSGSFSDQLHLFHASLGDFLEDKSRSGDLFIDTGLYSAQFSTTCMCHISTWLESAAEPRLDECTGSSRHSYYIFLEIFSQAQSDDANLLEALRYFPFKKFILTVFAIEKDPLLKQGILRRLPGLINWIQKQEDGTDLSKIYKEHYVDYIRSRLLPELVFDHSSWRHVFTALTLRLDNGEPTRYFWRLCSILDKADTLGQHMFFLSISEMSGRHNDPHLDYAIPILIEELTAADCKMNYHVDKQEYIKLAIELFDCLTIEKKKTGNGIQPGDWRLPLDLLVATFSRIPGEKVLGHYLRDSMKYRRSHDGIYSEATEFQACVEKYIKNCNLPEADALSPFSRLAAPVSTLMNHTLLGSTTAQPKPSPPKMVAGTRSLPSWSYLPNHQLGRDGHFNTSGLPLGKVRGKRDPHPSTGPIAMSSPAQSPIYPLPPAPVMAAHTRDRRLVATSFTGGSGLSIPHQTGLNLASSSLIQSVHQRPMGMQGLALSMGQLENNSLSPNLVSNVSRATPFRWPLSRGL